MHRIEYNGSLPNYFFEIPKKIYQNQSLKPNENQETISKLFALEVKKNEILIYTNYLDIRLVGIFPKNQDIAYFGFWETVNDIGLNQQAFKMLEYDVLIKGRKVIFGPINFNTYHAYRLRLSEPTWGVFDREPINPNYYPKLLHKCGLEESLTFESRMIKTENIKDVYIEKEHLLSEIKKIPFNFIRLTSNVWQTFELQIFELIQSVFRENPFFTDITFEQFKLYYNQSFAEKLCPHSSVIFQDKVTGDLASISICHPNYNSLALEKPTFDKDFDRLERKVLLAKTVGVHPDYRKKGLMNFMGAYGMLSFNNYYDEIIFCLMRTDNHSIHFTENIKHEAVKYALFKKYI